MVQSSTAVFEVSALFILLLVLVVWLKPKMFQEDSNGTSSCAQQDGQATKCCQNCAIDLKKFTWVFISGIVVVGLVYLFTKNRDKGTVSTPVRTIA